MSSEDSYAGAEDRYLLIPYDGTRWVELYHT